MTQFFSLRIFAFAFRLFVVFALFALFAQMRVARASVWETTDSWNDGTEQEYQAWVEAKWNKNFFNQSGHYYSGVEMDCAKAVYSMRFVYASENGLPFAIKDPTGGKGIISNKMTRWDNLPSEKRKRAFLLYIYSIASTASLPHDTYPVAVSRETIGAGRLLATDAASHHSWTIKSLSTTGVPFLLFASRPARTTLFERFEYPTTGFLFPRGLRPETNAGFRAFRQPQDLLKPVWDVPGYSLEQYQLPLKSWSSQLQKRLAVHSESGEQRLVRILENACRGAKERVDMVTKADALNRKLGEKCFSASQFDDYSTPSRDIRLKGSFDDLKVSYAALKQRGASLSPAVRAQVESVLLGDQGVSSSAYCPQSISKSKTLTLGQIYARLALGYMSANPNDTLNMRWGLEEFPSAKAESCPSY